MNRISKIVRSPGDPQVISKGPSSLSPSDRLGRALGWFSIGLGLTQLLMPHRITNALGIPGNETLVRAFGTREIVSGMTSLSVDKNLGLWSRVGGDAMDIVTLMGAYCAKTVYGAKNPKRSNVGLALAIVLGVTILDVLGAKESSAQHRRNRNSLRDYSDRSGFPKGAPKGKRGTKPHAQSQSQSPSQTQSSTEMH